MSNGYKDTAILLMHCPDRRGLVVHVTEFIDNNNGNIISLDEHVDNEVKIFFMRIEWELEGFLIISKRRSPRNLKWNGTFISAARDPAWQFLYRKCHIVFTIYSRECIQVSGR